MSKWHYTLELGPYPIKAYYAPSKKSWHRLLKKLKIKDEPYSKGAGQMATFYPKGKKNDPVCIVTVNCEGMAPYMRAGIIAHECVHVFQELIERIGEHNPSIEFEAYTIQSLVANVVWAWEDTFGNK